MLCGSIKLPFYAIVLVRNLLKFLTNLSSMIWLSHQKLKQTAWCDAKIWDVLQPQEEPAIWVVQILVIEPIECWANWHAYSKIQNASSEVWVWRKQIYDDVMLLCIWNHKPKAEKKLLQDTEITLARAIDIIRATEVTKTQSQVTKPLLLRLIIAINKGLQRLNANKIGHRR